MTDSINPRKLTPAQRARYEWALAEYNRIQERNKAPGMTTIAPGISPLIKHVPNPKSRLFARLLNGKPALPFPPPTSFSYPWYDLIEDGFSDNVSLDGFIDHHGREPDQGIVINQAVWKIMLHNAAAKSLMAFSERVVKTKSLVLSLQESLEAKQILQKKPEWIIKHGRNPGFRLYLSKARRRGRKDLLMTELLQRDFSGGNPEIIQTLGIGEVMPKPSALQAEPSNPKSRAALADRINAIELEMTASSNQTRYEWVVVECDAWCLEGVNS